MTEQEYINVRDLSNVLTMEHMIREITIGNQPNIPEKEYIEVAKLVRTWRVSLFTVVNKDTY